MAEVVRCACRINYQLVINTTETRYLPIMDDQSGTNTVRHGRLHHEVIAHGTASDPAAKEVQTDITEVDHVPHMIGMEDIEAVVQEA